MSDTAQGAGTRTAGCAALRRAGRYAIASSVVAGIFLSIAATSQATEATAASSTARIQALLDSPVNGIVNLPRGTFTVRPNLRLRHGERIVGHRTTLVVASGSGNYRAMFAGASDTTDLSGLTVTGVTFDQNAAGNPIRGATSLFKGMPRFVVLMVAGSDLRIINDRFIGSDDLNTIVTGVGTSNVTISNNSFKTRNKLMHDHSTIYTGGIGTVIRHNTFTGTAMVDSAAIEVHGDRASITSNHVSGYYRAANIIASDTRFTGNHVSGAANPVELWSFAPTALRHVAVSGNVLNRHLAYWRGLLARHGLSLAPAKYTRQVIRNPASPLPFYNIAVHDNRG